MMTRFIALANFLLQFTQVKQVIKKVLIGTTDSFQKNEATMIKDVISETTASIELKLNKLYFKLALGLVMVGVLAYGVIRLIWYFESYLSLNYGENYAILLLTVIVAAVSLQMIYAKYVMDKDSRDKRELNLENVQRDATLLQHEPGIFAAPEKLLHQAVLGFLDGFTNSNRKMAQLQLSTEDSTAKQIRNTNIKHQYPFESLQLDHLSGARH